MASKLLEKLIPMLAEQGYDWPGGAENCMVHKIRGGNATWSWCITDKNDHSPYYRPIGSPDTLTECVRFGFRIFDSYGSKELRINQPSEEVWKKVRGRWVRRKML